MLQSALQIELTTVPYKGTAPAMTDLIGGQVDLMCEQATNAVPQIEGRKVKVFGVTSPKRMTLPLLANVPTLNESGLKNFSVSIWHGLYAPRGTPPAVVAKLNQALKTALKDPDMLKRQESLGISVVTDNRLEPANHRKFVESEMARWSTMIKAAGQYAD
jgi:tripartite-type tricarboxylate transporter receptor subunit TctC